MPSTNTTPAAETTLTASIIEFGNGFPELGEHIATDDQEYVVVRLGSHVETQGAGWGNICHGYLLSPVEWGPEGEELRPYGIEIEEPCVDSDDDDDGGTFEFGTDPLGGSVVTYSGQVTAEEIEAAAMEAGLEIDWSSQICLPGDRFRAPLIQR